MKKTAVLISLGFCAGYVVADILSHAGFNTQRVAAAADVAGMSQYELRRDRDFRRAVEWVVEQCEVSNGYIIGQDISGMELSC